MSAVAAIGSIPSAVPVPQSANLLRTVMENAAVGMILAGIDGRITYSNRAFAEMFRCSPNDCLGMHMTEFVDPDDRQAASAQILRLISADTEQYQTERRYQRLDGSLFWGLSSVSLLRHDETGNPYSLVVQVVDIDRQKRAEAALAESESRWSFALEGAGQGVWDHNLRNKTAFFSPTWRMMRGYGPDEEVDGSYEAWIGRVHPDDRQRIAAATRRQDSGELSYNEFEYRERHRDGHWIWILSRGKPVEWLPDGRPARVVGTDTDISSLKATEAALAEEREKLSVTLRSIADGVLCVDSDGKITFLNPAAEQMTGWRSRDAIGKPVDDVFRRLDETGRVVDNPLSIDLATGRDRQICENMTLISRGGRVHEVRLSAANLELSRTERLGAVFVFQDISQSLALQRKLAHLASHDSLTGLYNRAAFERRLEEVLDEVGSGESQHALCFIDLDRFKAVNDTAGHAAGDALLQEVARTIQAKLREQDFVARIGGDEFALLLLDCDQVQASRMATDIANSIVALQVEHDGRSLGIGASIGLTAISGNSPSMGKLMEEADAACYAAKAAVDRGVVSFFDLPRLVEGSGSASRAHGAFSFWDRWSAGGQTGASARKSGWRRVR
jgi:diguanylate cyclase (GGDEF)-like protein/PAS domain S-box-containing protein